MVKCTMLNSLKSRSSHWYSINTDLLSKVTIISKSYIFQQQNNAALGNYMDFYLKCMRFRVPISNMPAPLTGKILTILDQLIISAASVVNFPTLLAESPATIGNSL